MYKIALLYGETHNETRAIANFKRLEKMDVEFLNYELAYAQTLEANQEFEAALEMAQKGMKKNPNAVPLLHFASKISFKLKDKAAAERYLMDALNLPELHDETVFLLANLYFNEEDFEAVINLEELLEDEHLLAKWLFAGAHKALENDSEAAALYEELIQTNLSENPEFLEDYIDFLKEIGQISKTEPIIEQYLELVPDDENMRNLLTDLKNNY